MVDLSEFAGLTKAQDDGIDVPITHPATGDDLGIVIRVAGPDSARQRKARAAVNNEQLAKGLGKKNSAAETEALGIRLTVAAIISWSGVVENGKDIEFNAENATDLLTRYPFVHDQIAAAVLNRAVFIKS